jgi:hypothetical protein
MEKHVGTYIVTPKNRIFPESGARLSFAHGGVTAALAFYPAYLTGAYPRRFFFYCPHPSLPKTCATARDEADRVRHVCAARA